MIAPLLARRTAVPGTALLAATVLLGAVSTAALAKAPKAGLLARVAAVGTVGYALKDNILEKGSEAVDKAFGAVFGNENEWEQLGKPVNWANSLAGELIKSVNPILEVPEIAARKVSASKKWLKAAVGKIERFAGDGSVDTRSALALGGTEERWILRERGVLNRNALPAVTLPAKREPGLRVQQWRKQFGIAPNGQPQDLYDLKEAKTEQNHRGVGEAGWREEEAYDPWGPDSGKGQTNQPAVAASIKSDVWGDSGGEDGQGRRIGQLAADSDPWGQDIEQKWDDSAAMPTTVESGDKPINTEWQNEYSVALNHVLGLNDSDSSYEAALSKVEFLEQEVVERLDRERRARRQQMEAQKRERPARLAAAQRERQIARMEAELKSARIRQSSRANAQALLSGVRNALGVVRPMLDHSARRIQREREARLRRDLAKLQAQAASQARAKQAYAVIERQRQHAAERQRLQVRRQGEIRLNLQKALNSCNNREALVTECIPGLSQPDCFERYNREMEKFERKKQECQQHAWSRYNQSGGKAILGTGRLQ